MLAFNYFCKMHLYTWKRSHSHEQLFRTVASKKFHERNVEVFDISISGSLAIV